MDFFSVNPKPRIIGSNFRVVKPTRQTRQPGQSPYGGISLTSETGTKLGPTGVAAEGARNAAMQITGDKNPILPKSIEGNAANSGAERTTANGRSKTSQNFYSKTKNSSPFTSAILKDTENSVLKSVNLVNQGPSDSRVHVYGPPKEARAKSSGPTRIKVSRNTRSISGANGRNTTNTGTAGGTPNNGAKGNGDLKARKRRTIIGAGGGGIIDPSKLNKDIVDNVYECVLGTMDLREVIDMRTGKPKLVSANTAYGNKNNKKIITASRQKAISDRLAAPVQESSRLKLSNSGSGSLIPDGTVRSNGYGPNGFGAAGQQFGAATTNNYSNASRAPKSRPPRGRTGDHGGAQQGGGYGAGNQGTRPRPNELPSVSATGGTSGASQLPSATATGSSFTHQQLQQVDPPNSPPNLTARLLEHSEQALSHQAKAKNTTESIEDQRARLEQDLLAELHSTDVVAAEEIDAIPLVVDSLARRNVKPLEATPTQKQDESSNPEVTKVGSKGEQLQRCSPDQQLGSPGLLALQVEHGNQEVLQVQNGMPPTSPPISDHSMGIVIKSDSPDVMHQPIISGTEDLMFGQLHKAIPRQKMKQILTERKQYQQMVKLQEKEEKKNKQIAKILQGLEEHGKSVSSRSTKKVHMESVQGFVDHQSPQAIQETAGNSMSSTAPVLGSSKPTLPSDKTAKEKVATALDRTAGATDIIPPDKLEEKSKPEKPFIDYSDPNVVLTEDLISPDEAIGIGIDVIKPPPELPGVGGQITDNLMSTSQHAERKANLLHDLMGLENEIQGVTSKDTAGTGDPARKADSPNVAKEKKTHSPVDGKKTASDGKDLKTKAEDENVKSKDTVDDIIGKYKAKRGAKLEIKRKRKNEKKAIKKSERTKERDEKIKAEKEAKAKAKATALVERQAAKQKAAEEKQAKKIAAAVEKAKKREETRAAGEDEHEGDEDVEYSSVEGDDSPTEQSDQEDDFLSSISVSSDPSTPSVSTPSSNEDNEGHKIADSNGKTAKTAAELREILGAPLSEKMSQQDDESRGQDENDMDSKGDAYETKEEESREEKNSSGDESSAPEIPLYCRFIQPADPIYRETEGFEEGEVPPTSLMLQLNQSATWYHEDPYSRAPADRRCLCRELNESFIWIDSDPSFSSEEEQYEEEDEDENAQYYQQEDTVVRRAVSF